MAITKIDSQVVDGPGNRRPRGHTESVRKAISGSRATAAGSRESLDDFGIGAMAAILPGIGQPAKIVSVITMTSKEFQTIRLRLQKTQAGMANLLGISGKAVESYEQGWRRIPSNIERIAYFLLFKIHGKRLPKQSACWIAKKCPPATRRACPAWIAHEGFYCWFLTGKSCRRERKLRSSSQRQSCFDCDFFQGNLRKIGIKLD